MSRSALCDRYGRRNRHKIRHRIKNMGSAVSKNITSATTEAIAKVSNNIVQQTKLSTDQTQIISVTDIDGDVTISGNTFTQKANINLKSLMNVLVQEDIQQALTMEIAQACKSIVSGLNIFQFPDAKNEINLFLKASAELVNTISQSCSSSLSENQVITVSRVKGNVYITNNLMQEFADLFQSCVQEAVSKNSIYQKLQEKVDQNATAKAEGLDLWQIIILVALVLGIPAASVVGGVAVVGKYLFPLALVAGTASLLAYYNMVSETVSSHGFSKLIRNIPDCGATPMSRTVTAFATSNAAAQACANDKSCAAFDWQGSAIDQQGNHISFTPPQTTFYSAVSGICEQTIKQSPDHSKVFRNPIFVKGRGRPTTANGDAYLDIATAEYYFFDQSLEMWIKQGSFAHSDFTMRNSIDWGMIVPKPNDQSKAGSIYVYYSPNDPVYFRVYVKQPDGWIFNNPILKGPGLIPDTPDNINVSGFTTVTHRTWLLYLGLSLLGVGLIGLIPSFKERKRPENLISF